MITILTILSLALILSAKYTPGTRRFFLIGTSALVAFILIFAWGVVRSAN